MNTLPNEVRRMVQARVLDNQLRDQVLMGYRDLDQTFWLACVDGQGEIDHEFSEWMSARSYGLFMQLVGNLVALRGGHVSAELVMAALNSETLQ